MAGAGTTLFTAGSVLTAAQVNTYLMDQTVMRFADASTRDAAFGGIGEPVLAEGMLCYLDDENAVFVNIDGTSGGWEEIGFNGNYDVSTRTNNYTLGLNDAQSIVQMNVAGANTVTIPTNSVSAFDIGSHVVIAQLGAGQTTIVGDTGVTVYPSASVQIPRQYSTVNLVKVATNTWYVIGELTGEITNADISASAAIADTKLATISTANKVSIAALDIDGGTDIGAALVDADLLIVDDGANGTNRKTELTRLATYLFGKVSGAITVSSTGAATLNNDDDQLVLAARLFI